LSIGLGAFFTIPETPWCRVRLNLLRYEMQSGMPLLFR
jgi:hypothetical protein